MKMTYPFDHRKCNKNLSYLKEALCEGAHRSLSASIDEEKHVLEDEH